MPAFASCTHTRTTSHSVAELKELLRASIAKEVRASAVSGEAVALVKQLRDKLKACGVCVRGARDVRCGAMWLVLCGCVICGAGVLFADAVVRCAVCVRW